MGLTAITVGAMGSLSLLFTASRSRPPVLMAIFVVWVLAPFLGLLLADRCSRSWPVPVRATLYGMMLAMSLGALAIYGFDAMWPRQQQAAFVYVAFPPASCLLSVVSLGLAAVLSRRG